MIKESRKAAAELKRSSNYNQQSTTSLLTKGGAPEAFKVKQKLNIFY